MEERAKKIAELLKLLANEQRLLILCALLEGKLTVSDIHPDRSYQRRILPGLKCVVFCGDEYLFPCSRSCQGTGFYCTPYVR